MKTILATLSFLLFISCSSDRSSSDETVPGNINTLMSKITVTQKQGNTPETSELYVFKYNNQNKVEKVLLSDNSVIYDVKYNSNNKPSEFYYFDEPQNFKFYYDGANKLNKIVKNISGQTVNYNITYENGDNVVKVSNQDNYGNTYTETYTFSNII